MIEPEATRILLVPDTHAPNHHKPSWNLMLKAARIFKPHWVVVLGDFIDCESLSGHDPSTSRGRRFFKDELEEARRPLEELRRLSWPHTARGKVTLSTRGPSKFYYIKGNHEWRLDRFIAKRAPELDGLVDIEQHLGLEKSGWHVTEYRDTLRLGHLNLTHDTGSAGANAHRTASNDFKGNAIIGHTHRMSLDIVGRPRGEPILAAMLGWLGDPKKIDYVHQAKAQAWVHGFGVAYLDHHGIAHVQPVPIVSHSCCLAGQIIRL